jgi:hypothetical protein|tara:strand:+ start:428 stop:751 length:324 start_codon:yes stop_codon:yes gene_type:complete
VGKINVLLGMGLKIVDINKKRGKPTIGEIIDSCESMLSNYEIRGETRLNASLTLMSYAFSQILDSTSSEDTSLHYVNEILSNYIDQSGMITFIPEFDVKFDPDTPSN